jgi:hypothetical protein
MEHGDFKLSETLTKQMFAFLRANGVDTSTKASKVSKYKTYLESIANRLTEQVVGSTTAAVQASAQGGRIQTEEGQRQGCHLPR